MASAKHGRLFTEADVVRLLDLTLDQPLTPGQAQSWLDECPDGIFTFPADEPLFLLRGQDFYAPDAVADYRDALDMVPDAVGVEHREAVQAAYLEMNDWQSRHPDRVNPPD